MPIIEISSLSHPGVEIFSTLTEAQLRNRIEPTKGIFIAESPKVISVAIDAGYKPLALLCEQKHITGDAATIIQVCKAGKTFEYDDEEGMLHFLTSLLNNFNPQSPIKENNVVNRYSRKSLTQSLTQILAHHED